PFTMLIQLQQPCTISLDYRNYHHLYGWNQSFDALISLVSQWIIPGKLTKSVYNRTGYAQHLKYKCRNCDLQVALIQLNIRDNSLRKTGFDIVLLTGPDCKHSTTCKLAAKSVNVHIPAVTLQRISSEPSTSVKDEEEPSQAPPSSENNLSKDGSGQSLLSSLPDLNLAASFSFDYHFETVDEFRDWVADFQKNRGFHYTNHSLQERKNYIKALFKCSLVNCRSTIRGTDGPNMTTRVTFLPHTIDHSEYQPLPILKDNAFQLFTQGRTPATVHNQLLLGRTITIENVHNHREVPSLKQIEHWYSEFRQVHNYSRADAQRLADEFDCIFLNQILIHDDKAKTVEDLLIIITPEMRK
ncbi:hypothetical protein Ciccas_014303, partial [Cichlidogyrus casuarinus]